MQGGGAKVTVAVEIDVGLKCVHMVAINSYLASYLLNNLLFVHGYFA